MQIGPSYFMRPGLNREWLERIWAHSVIPYVEEQFFDEPDRAEDFALAAIEQRLHNAPPATTEPNEEAVNPEPETDPASGVETN
jgi:hypothetical protein